MEAPAAGELERLDGDNATSRFDIPARLIEIIGANRHQRRTRPLCGVLLKPKTDSTVTHVGVLGAVRGRLPPERLLAATPGGVRRVGRELNEIHGVHGRGHYHAIHIELSSRSGRVTRRRPERPSLDGLSLNAPIG